MTFISKSTIQEVNDRLDAVAIVGDYVRLEKKSGRWWGRCPFHGGGQEKTPSFKVDPDLKLYHCFGCNKGGSVIGFVMEMDKLTYPEAIKNIARKMGIEIVYEEGKEEDIAGTSLKEELFELYRRTTGTFQHFLNNSPEGKNAKKYLAQRGFSEEMIETFKIGFAPPGREYLFNFLKQKGYSDEFLEKSGLFSKSYKSLSLFSERLIFPITDRQGRIVAFGGRAMPGAVQSDGKEPPKYINSPETEIYKKGQTLYAIDLAKPQMRQTKTVYLAEGYLDVIALHQADVSNAVAPLGTAFTDEQAVWLRRWVENVVLIFDNDEAGVKAAYKAILTCRKNGLSCALVRLTEGVLKETGGEQSQKFKDPAEILQEFTPQVLKKVVNCTINDFEYLISLADGNINRVVEFLFPYLDVLESEVERDDYIARIADVFRVDRKAVLNDYLGRKKTGYSSRSISEEKQGDTDFTVRRNAELVLLTTVAVNMELYGEFRSALEIKEIDDPAAKELFIALEECFMHEESGMYSLLDRIKNENLKKFIVSNGDSPEFRGSNTQRQLEDGIKKIKIKNLEKKRTAINAQMRQMERNGEEIFEDSELLSEKMRIDEEIRNLQGR